MFSIFKNPAACLCPQRITATLNTPPHAAIPAGADIPAIEFGKLESVVNAAPKQPGFDALQRTGKVLGDLDGGGGGAAGARASLQLPGGGGGGINASGVLPASLPTNSATATASALNLPNPTAATASASALNVPGLRIPAAATKIPLDDAALGKLSALPVATAQVKAATGINLAAPRLDAKAQATLDSLAAAPAKLPPLPPAPQLDDPQMQTLFADVSRLQTCRANTGIDLSLDADAALKMQKTAATLASGIGSLPPLPVLQLAPLARLSMLIRLCEGFGIDITSPNAFAKLNEAICNTTKNLETAGLPAWSASAPPAPPVGGGGGFSANGGGIGGDFDTNVRANLNANAAALASPNSPAAAAPDYAALSRHLALRRASLNANAYFDADLSALSPDAFSQKVTAPLLRASASLETANANLPITPEQLATCDTYAAARQYLPALRLMERYDLSRLDLAPLADLPPLDSIPDPTPLALSASLGDSTSSLAKWEKCPACPMA